MDLLSPVGSLLGIADPASGGPQLSPILTQLPAAQSAFQTKYADPSLQQSLAGLPPSLSQSLISFDQSRVNRGQRPLSAPQTANVLSSYINNAPTTPPESQGFFGRLGGDLQSLISEVPRLPVDLVQEALALPQAPAALGTALGAGSLGGIAQGLTQVPGLRMVPGVYTASQLLNNGPAGVLEHPLFSALDVLPYAEAPIASAVESAASRLPRVAEARAALAPTLDASNEARTAAGLAPLPEPSSTRLALQTSPLRQYLAATRPGQLASSAFSSTARDLAQLWHGTLGNAQAVANPTITPAILTADTQILRDAITTARDWSSTISPERRAVLTDLMSQSRDAAYADPSLTDPERAFVDQAVQHNDQLGAFAVRQGWLSQIDGEYFTPTEASRILKSRASVARYSTLSDARSTALTASPDTLPQTLNAIDPTSIVSEHLSRADQLVAAQSYAYALQSSGIDASPLFDSIRAARTDRTIPTTSIRDTLVDTINNPTAATRGVPVEPTPQMGDWVHVTTPETARAIRANGFRVGADEMILGPGVYVGQYGGPGMEAMTGQIIESQIANGLPEVATYPVSINPQAKIFNLDQDPFWSYGGEWRVNDRALRDVGLDPTVYQEELQRSPYQPKRALAATAKRAGYSGVEDGYQRVMFNPEDVQMAPQLNGGNRVPYSPQAIVDNLRPYVGTLGKGDPTVARATALIANGDYSAAAKSLSTLTARSTHLIPEADAMLEDLRNLRDKQNFLNRTSTFNDRVTNQLTKANAAIEARTLPARFTPLVESGVESQLRDLYASDPQALQLIQEHLYSQLPDLSQSELNGMYRDIAKTWQQLKAEGHDPVFVHRVSPSAVPSVNRVSLTDTLTTPSSIRARTLDATPYVHDTSVALTDQAMGFLSRLAQEEFTNHLLNIYGTPGADLESRLLPAARAANESNPALGVDAHLQNLIQRQYARYDPSGIFPHTRGRIGAITGTGSDTYIPRTVDTVLRQMFHPGPTRLTALTDPIMKVFRTALIPLSPRSFLHHFVGAGVQLMGESDPGVFLRRASEARDLINSGEFSTLKGMPPSGFGDAPPDIVDWGKTATQSDKLVAAQNLMAGKFFRKVWDGIAPARDAFNNVVDKSYAFRSHMDDMYRSIAYLEGKDKGLTAGLTEDQAHQAGIALTRKVFQNWDRMTPLERTVMRSVFPFYGYMSQVLRYAFRYPIDHPFRVGVVSNFARNEAQDFGTSLPSRFLDAMFLGNPDPKTGVVRAANLSTFNPFRDVANYFTLAGFTGASNPLIASALTALGVDPRIGAQDLYPDLKVDPVSGQIRPVNESFLSSFASNLIPQAQIFTALAGRNDTIKQLLVSNPEAAASMLRSSAALPSLFLDINPAQEAFKYELHNEQVADTVKNQALSSGDTTRAMNFPSLRAYFQQIAAAQQQNPQLFSKFAPPATSVPSFPETAREAFIGLNVP